MNNIVKFEAGHRGFTDFVFLSILKPGKIHATRPTTKVILSYLDIVTNEDCTIKK